jgi:hypothetical protein
MTNSQNGWPVVGKSACDTKPLIRDIAVPNGVLAGDVAVIFRWLAKEYDRRVEPLHPGWCWGWYVKAIEGTSVVSNHASATAVDFNAPSNPMGTATRKVLTEDQIAQCHRLEDESDNVLRWGGDYVSRPDSMHWEIVGSRAAVRRLAAKLRNATSPRKPVTQAMTVSVPLLREGDDDAKLDGYNLITRMQRIVGASDDGMWGAQTTKAIAAWCNLPVGECRTLSEAVARKVLGLGK